MAENQPAKTAASLFAQFIVTTVAVWLGGILAGGTLFYIGKGELEAQLNRVTEYHRQEQLRLDEELRKRLEAEQKLQEEQK